MSYKYLEKAVYIRETTDGKTKWVRLPGIMARNMHSTVQVIIDKNEYKQNDLLKNRFPTEIVYEHEGTA